MRDFTSHQMPGFTVTSDRNPLFMLLPALFLMLGVIFFLFLFVMDLGESAFELERPYLIPWVIATGLVVVAPSVYLKYRNEFSVTHPLVFAALTYFFPIFFLGGLSLAFGLSSHYYLNYVTDPQYNFPLAFLCAMVGYAGLSAGFFIPKGKNVGNYIASWLPKWDFKPEEIVIGSLVCLAVGIFLNISALELGQIGFQSTADDALGETVSLNYYLTIIAPTSSFLLWIAFFKFKEWNFYHLIIAVVQILTAGFMLVILGGKSSLLQSLVLAIGAFVLVKRKVVLKHWVIFTAGLLICLIVGVIYGTKFRNLKGGNDRISAEKYGEVAFESMAGLGDGDMSVQLQETFEVLAERLEIVSSLAVVVSNYEALSTYEASYGLENNIWTYTWTAFIPRFLWKDKPVIADNYSYNELYFDHGGFGLAITAMGDLLRNFGPLGVPLGMIVLGFVLRIFYAMFVEGQPFSAWRTTIYFLVLTRINYDSFYGEILPTTLRIAAVIFIQLFILKIVIYAMRRNNT
ncbi:MAG: hypothetical protein H7070_00165 [Saprospiraceae bacterium]|nr:hypothetical protein [Pyrinomonadaceae bacterium]